MPGMRELVEFAEGSRQIGVDMVHFAWIGDLSEGSEKAFSGVRTSLHLTNVPWNRIVFWCESRNKRLAEAVLFKVSPKIWVMSMSELFDAWKRDDREVSPSMVLAARHVYTSLKRLAAFSAAKDLASLCILRTVGGYFFDASIRFIRELEFFSKVGKQPPRGWRTDTTMPALDRPHWVMDAWALYVRPHTDTTRKALNNYLLASSQAGINYRKRIGPDFYKSVIETKYKPDMTRHRSLFQQQNLGLKDEEVGLRVARVGLIQDLISTSLAVGWGDEAAMFEQRDIDTGLTPLLTLPGLGLLKELGSSLIEPDPSKWTGWKATLFRDWSIRLR